jgi:hypothetical protein
MRLSRDSSLSSITAVAACAAVLLFVGTVVVPFGILAAAPEDVEAAPEVPATRRCQTCGWIESSRQIASGADNRAIRTDEYTVRMTDGSSRTFAAGPGETWRMRERIRYIDGSRR